MVAGDEVIHRQLKDAVYAQILEKILDGTLPAGYALREGELAARFGVSKTPLRDALVRLQAEGLVSIPPYRSAVVVGYSQQDLREIYEVRELLEGACAREAALTISTDDLAELSQLMRDSAVCIAGGEVLPGQEETLAALIDRFDVIMYAQCRNRRINEMVANIRNHIQRIGRLTTRIPGRMVKSVREHQAIYEAIVQRDGTAAETAMRRHILSVMADQLVNIANAADPAASASAAAPTGAPNQRAGL
jgi:DNA-binding GntR family transcriptional regulator